MYHDITAWYSTSTLYNVLRGLHVGIGSLAVLASYVGSEGFSLESFAILHVDMG